MPPPATLDDQLAALRPMLAVAGRAEDVAVGFRHELKWDGMRVLATVDSTGALTLRSRAGNDVTARYPELAVVADRLVGPTVVDAEVVAFDGDGAASFQRLQGRMHLADDARVRHAQRTTPVHLVVFDVLIDAGASLLRAPLEERRGRLEALALHGGAVQVPPSDDDLERMLEIARVRGEEGVVSKRLGSIYRPGVRSADWVKLPFARRREVVVAGWRPEGGRHPVGGGIGPIGALLLGAYDDRGELRYLGAVGSGLAGRAGELVRSRLTPAARSAFADAVPHADARPVVPELVGTVRHRGRTGEGRLRQPVWTGLRDDVDPVRVRLEADGSDHDPDVGRDDAADRRPGPPPTG
jgi:bifunctional non-homologous end joining protein LigD